MGIIFFFSRELFHKTVKMSSLRFDNRVVIVTGAGGGLGRSHALEFAKRGAKVVVNDLGGDTKGDKGGSSRAADVVVDEIKKAGGIAVPNYDSVLDGAKIVKTAIDAFGRIDIVVNNAGILRDVSFHRMTDKDWDLIFDVHVKGSYAVARAAWPYMREQKFGRIVNTTSAAGLYGNFGQTNYSAAKMALVGFTSSLAKEGQKRNVFSNVIAPVAGSRMTATVMPPELVERLKPEFVSPLVAYLCHESTQVNGGIFEVGAGWMSQVRLQRTEGAFVPVDALDVEAVRDNWTKVTNFDGIVEYPTTMNDSMGNLLGNLENKSGAKKDSSSSSSASSSSSSSGSVNVSGFQASAIFQHLQGVIKQQAAQLQKDIGGTFRFDVKNKSGAEQSWRVAVPKTGDAGVHLSEKSEKADVVLSMDDETLVGVMSGKTNPQTAFMSGKMKFKGSMPLVMKLSKLKGNAKL